MITKNEIIRLLRAEIKWCEAHKHNESQFEKGFMNGLKQAIRLIRKAKEPRHDR
jgi:hypothetical protein